MHEGETDGPVPEVAVATTDPLDAALPQLPIAGAVASEEELLNVQQIALITRWLRVFSGIAAQVPGAKVP